jgi:hypothetical protein
MKPIYEAKRIALEAGESFEKNLTFYLEHGVVISLPDRLLMGRAIQLELGEDVLYPPKPNCWFVHCAVGDNSVTWFCDQAPVKLPYIAWRRSRDKSGRLRVYNTSAFERLARLLT